MTLLRRLDETRGAAPARGSIARRSQVGPGPHAPGPPLLLMAMLAYAALWLLAGAVL